MSSFTAVYDACVLYPAPLRDLLMHLALTDLFRARWSDMIHDEWTGNLLKNRPDLTAEQLAWTRARMNAHIPDATVTDFEELIPSLVLPDPDDRHVLAAAIRGRADVIVTKNLKDFPAASLAQYDVSDRSPKTEVNVVVSPELPTSEFAISDFCRKRPIWHRKPASR